MSAEGEHSVVPPSGMDRLVQCSGSHVMQAPFPEQADGDTAQAAADGTAAHWVMAELMAERTVDVGVQAPNGVFITAEMIEAAEMIVDDVLATIRPYGMTLAHCATEVPVGISRIHPLCWGTPDIRVWLPDSTLVVWDLKFGFRNVDVFECMQLVAYDVGCLDQAGLGDRNVQIINRIVQPRSYHHGGPVREWRVQSHALAPLVLAMQTAVAEALGPNPVTRVGPGCRDCRAAHACETLQRAGETAMDVAGAAMPHVLPADAVGVELRNITRMFDLLKARKESLEEQALALGRRGARIPHFKLGSGEGRQTWRKRDVEVIAMGRLLGLNFSKPPAAITPLQAVKAGMPDVLLSTYVERKPGATKLIPDDGSELRRIFSL